ncbi:kynureninase [Alkalicoccus urumqiensis]|uniref:Kynureninase n=1 Tax=Alkalicoccus urumqiensis TaxID=1548213 RepID=A0A2P6MIL9_ALKUR|nr:kynureninase [Alkalicoccus urumqiensis]PRO66129.1 kynureninase [Alkalicoccus urumqiensis]
MNELYEIAQQLDLEDPLKHVKSEFYFPEEKPYYLDGNSLGLMSRQAESAVHNVLDSWKRFGIDGWEKGESPWFTYTHDLRKMSAELIGASFHETAVTGSITSNLHQLLTTFYRPSGKRRKIVMDELAFPTDAYAVKSQLLLHGASEDDLVMIPSADGRLLEMAQIESAIDEETALVLLPTVLYRSGQLLPWKQITDCAHNHGAVIGWDLAHSFGAMPHDLHESGVDFAVWCTYKYANGGPGACGGLFVHEKHADRTPALAGWFGSNPEVQFDMDLQFEPAPDASAYQQGTPHLLSLAPLKGSLQIIQEAGIDAVRSRSLQLTGFLLKGIQELQEVDPSLEVVTPEQGRGGHLAVCHPDAARISRSLKDHGVVPDFRMPDVIRLAPSPLYTSFMDLAEVIEILKNILRNKPYLAYPNERGTIA